MTGVLPQPPVDPKFREPGNFRVDLLDPGPGPISVVKAVRQVSGLDFGSARDLVDNAPTPIVSGISHAAAELVRKQVKGEGGTATVVSQDVSA